jgi:hypothetical protein
VAETSLLRYVMFIWRSYRLSRLRYEISNYEMGKCEVMLTLEQAMKAQTLSLTSALDGGGWSTPCPGRLTPGKDPIPIVYEAGWAPRPVWTGAENPAPHPPGFDPQPVALLVMLST